MAKETIEIAMVIAVHGCVVVTANKDNRLPKFPSCGQARIVSLRQMVFVPVPTLRRKVTSPTTNTASITHLGVGKEPHLPIGRPYLVHPLGLPTWSTHLVPRLGPPIWSPYLVQSLGLPTWSTHLVPLLGPATWSANLVYPLGPLLGPVTWSANLVHPLGPPTWSAHWVCLLGPPTWSAYLVHPLDPLLGHSACQKR